MLKVRNLNDLVSQKVLGHLDFLVLAWNLQGLPS